MATVVVQQHALTHDPGSATVTKALDSVSDVLDVRSSGSNLTTEDSLDFITSSTSSRDTKNQASSLLYPPAGFLRVSDHPSIYSIDASTLAAAVDHLAAQPLPNPSQVFPWLYGLHPERKSKKAGLTNRKRFPRYAPDCWRGITLIKAGGNLTKSKLKGAVAPQEVLEESGGTFLEKDPRRGFSIRDFQIQTAKLAPLSDVVVYGEDGIDEAELHSIAASVTAAQKDWMHKNDIFLQTPRFNTFVVSGESSSLIA